MSRFLSERFASLEPYTPGEQPRDMAYVKLNTNESPFPPSPEAAEAAAQAARRLNLYSDPCLTCLRKELSRVYGVQEENVLCFNGSDEALLLCFMAFCDGQHPAAFADITYGLYPVLANVTGAPFEVIPLKDDLTLNANDYVGIGKTVFIANPNAPTGIALAPDEIRRIAQSNPQNAVVVDEAYVDFGAESCLGLLNECENLVIVRTFSKSRSMAGARLGFVIAGEELIRDLDALRYSVNPYNVNSMTLAAGEATVKNEAWMHSCAQTICLNRTWTEKELKALGFEMTPSKANFLFVRHPRIGGKELYLKLKARGVLVRHFDRDRIRDFNRVTVGSLDDMKALVRETKAILEEIK